MFKPGDKVRSVRNYGVLKKDKVYTVDYIIDDEYVHLAEEGTGGWFPERFELVEPQVQKEEKAMEYIRVVTTTAIQQGAIAWDGPKVHITKTFPGKVQLEMGAAGIVIVGKQQALEFSKLFKEIHDAL